MITRRRFVKLTFVSAFGASVRSPLAQIPDFQSEAIAQGKAPFKLPLLQYAPNALDPLIDEQTMRVHHEGRHAALVLKLNKEIHRAMDWFAAWQFGGCFVDNSGEEFIRQMRVPEKLFFPIERRAPSEELQSAIRNAAQAHYNHSLFWRMMKPGGGGEPSGELRSAVLKSFGSFSAFKTRFIEIAGDHAGEGWAWLTLEGNTLKVETTREEGNPWIAGRAVLLGADLWRHAYEAKYRSDRGAYLRAWFNVVNWSNVAERFVRFTKL